MGRRGGNYLTRLYGEVFTGSTKKASHYRPEIDDMNSFILVLESFGRVRVRVEVSA